MYLLRQNLHHTDSNASSTDDYPLQLDVKNIPSKVKTIIWIYSEKYKLKQSYILQYNNCINLSVFQLQL